MNWSSLVLRQAVMCRRAAAQGDESPSPTTSVRYCNILLYQCIAIDSSTHTQTCKTIKSLACV